MYEIIVNPASKSGKGQKIWSQLEPILIGRNISYHVNFSTRAGHVTEIVKGLTASLTSDSPLLNIIVLGGDGTMNETLQGVSCFERVQIGYIPTGSSNDFARDLHLPKDPVSLLNRILDCISPRFMDVGQLTYGNTEQLSRLHSQEAPSFRQFGVSCGIGFDAAVCEEALASRFKNILNKLGIGKLTYLSIALKQIISSKKIPCDIYLDDNEPIHLPKFLFVAAMIHQYEGGGFKFCPGALDNDGLLDVCVVGNISKPLIFFALPTAFTGNHYRFNGIDHYLVKKLRIETQAPLWVHTDGEVHTKSSSITMTCQQQKLALLL